MIRQRLRSSVRFVVHFWSCIVVKEQQPYVTSQELRTFMDSTLLVDPDLVTESVRTLALNTLSAYQNGVTLKWNDAELAVYLVYIFGEINKCEYPFTYTLGCISRLA